MQVLQVQVSEPVHFFEIITVQWDIKEEPFWSWDNLKVRFLQVVSSKKGRNVLNGSAGVLNGKKSTV